MSKFKLLKEIEEFDKKLQSMTDDEVMEMLIDNGYGEIDSPEEHGYQSIFGNGITMRDASELLQAATMVSINQPEPSIEPIEVTMTEYNYYGADSLYARFYKCSKCGSEYVVEKNKYCSSCGVKLNWE